MSCLLIAACALQIVQHATAAPDSLRVFDTPSDAIALTNAVRRRPDDARESLRRLLALTASPLPDSARQVHLGSAMRLARIFASVWADSFPMHQVAEFARWTPERRAAKVLVDSLRHAGVSASNVLGIAAAQRLWRASLQRARAISDSAGEAAALGNIGAGYYLAGQSDSASLYLTRAREIALVSGDLRTAANAMTTLASVNKDRGDLVRARQLYSDSRALHERIGDVGGLASDQNNIGLIAQSLGDLTGARHAFASALVVNRQYERMPNVATNLTNLANIATVAVDYDEAARLYGEALAIYRARGARVDAAFVQRNVALLEMRRGDYPRAQSLMREALATYQITGPIAEVVETRRELALAAAAMGDIQGGIGELRRAEQSATRVRDRPNLLGALALTRADLLVELNSLADADREYMRAARLYRAANDEAGQIAAREGRGVLLLLRQDPDAALTELESVARAHTNDGDQRAAATTMLLIGYARQQRGDASGARLTLGRAASWFRASGDTVSEAMALATLGDIESENGQMSRAEALYREGLTRLANRVAPDVAWRLRAGLGEVLQARGASSNAVRELRLAVGEVERTAGPIRIEERRSAFLEDKWSVYAQLALAERGQGDETQAFATSERLRARQMLSLLTRGRVPPADAADTIRSKEQELRRRIDGLTNALLDGVGVSTLRGAKLSDASLDAMRATLDSAQRAYASLLLEMKETNPEYARVVSTETVGWRDAAALLAPDEALIEYLVTDSTTIAFVVTTRGLSSVDLHVSHHALATLVDFARANLAQPDDLAARELWRAPLRRLYQELVAPLEGSLHGKSKLIIVPHRELHYLPFASLVIADRSPARMREPFLVERYVLEYTPSVSVWIKHSATREAAQNNRVLALAPRTATLPASRAEVEAIGRIYGTRATVLTGAAASEEAFRRSAPASAIIHLATFGVLNKRNPLFSFVDLAPGEGQDGRLEVREALGLSLHARLLILSACQTAVSSGALEDVPVGDDWVGLVQAFLVAGASNVMGTLWPVEDRTTAQLMERFYIALKSGKSEAEALAEAQRSTLRDGATAHPFYWGGFSIVARREACATGQCMR
jgi:CHAT domain-containing protein/tetratricopeptide (TPR) repeat protein